MPRSGALALGVSGLLLAIFPLIRPFFPFDPTAPAAALAGASRAVASPPWVAAHFLATLAFVLLLCALPVLSACLTGPGLERPARRATTLSVVGIALVLPTLGVELYALPAIGRLYLDGKTEIAPIVGLIYLGPATLVMVLGLLLLAIGAIMFAVVIWRSGVLPKWAGVIFAAGLAFWLPLLPRSLRVVDGLLIGIGGVWLAWSMRRRPT